MAYYDPLITAWNSVTQPPVGVTGAALTGKTTVQKLAAVQAWTAVGAAIPSILPTYKIYNSIVPAEFTALTAANQQLVRDILGMGTVDASAGTSVRVRMVAIFPNGTTTFTNLSVVVAPFDSPQVSWMSKNGYSDLTLNDVAAAGLN